MADGDALGVFHLRALRVAWWSAFALALATLLLPDPGGAVAAFGLLSGYPGEVAGNVYRLIRVAMPWLPAGVLLGLVWPRQPIMLGVLLAVALGLAAALVGSPDAPDLRLARDLLFVVPAVSAGLWLAQWSGLRSAAAAAMPLRSAERLPRPQERPVVPSTPTSLPARALCAAATLPLLAAIAWAWSFPHWGPAIAAALALYAALLWWRPLAALVVVPAALPLFDLAPWTGRFFVDEFDLLLVVTAAVLVLRAPPRRPVRLARLAAPVILLYLAAMGVSALIGLWPLGALDANAFSSYWSPYNALRVAKGFVWGALLFWMIRRAPVGEATLARLLALGMGLGLLGVGLVGGWERWVFAGLADEDSTYRIVSTFSSMHTGGGHIEAWLVAALPFAWLALFSRLGALLVLPVLLLSAYVMLYTVARGGVLAFVVVAAVLVVATLRTSARSGLKRALLPMLAMVGVTLVVIAGARSGYMMQRFETVSQDWDTRVAHWRNALDIADGSWRGRLFGTGLGAFPRVYLERGPDDRQPATYGFVTEQGDNHLRLGVGETAYVGQRVDVSAGAAYRLSLDARARQPGAELSAPLCEKQVLSSRRCDWHKLAVPGDGQWHTLGVDIPAATVGAGPPWTHLPVELYFHNGGKGGAIDVHNVRLLDAQGRDLVSNGDFSAGGDYWFLKTRSHLPYHIKNLWVHTAFASGVVGLLLLSVLVLASAFRLARAGWRGSRLAWAMGASLAGMLVVGTFDSLTDAPRLTMLLVAWLFVGIGLAW